MSTYPNIYVQKFGDCYTLSAFANGVGNAHDNDLGSQLAVGAILGGIPLAKATVWDGPKWLFDNFGHYGETWNKMREAHNAQKNLTKTFKTNLAEGRTNIFDKSYNWLTNSERLQQYQSWQAKPMQARISCDPARYKSLFKKTTKEQGLFKETAKSRLYRMTYRKSNRLIDEAYKPVKDILERTKGLKGAELRTALKELEYAGYHAELKVLQGRKSGAIKSVGRWAKAWNGVKTYSGYNKLNRGLLKGMTYGIDDAGKVIAGKGDKIGAKALRTVAKGAKGGGLLTAGIEMAFETPEIIETYSKLGVAKGTKQLGKSAATATASAVGWVAGAKVGGILGAKIGGLIGSIFPGPGTVIGGAIGSIIGVGCGIAGSWACHNGMKSLMGKSELEKAKDENTLAMAKKASESSESKAELLKKIEETAPRNEKGELVINDENVRKAYIRVFNDLKGNQTIDYTQSKDGKSALVQQLEQQHQTENNSQVTNKKLSLLYQLENFNANLYQGSNPFNQQSIFS
jgi:hypothetical protein